MAFAPIGLGLLVLAQFAPTRGALWVGFPAATVVLWLVGRRERVAGRREWAKAGCLFVLLGYLLFGAGIFLFAIAGCPGIEPGC